MAPLKTFKLYLNYLILPQLLNITLEGWLALHCYLKCSFILLNSSDLDLNWLAYGTSSQAAMKSLWLHFDSGIYYLLCPHANMQKHAAVKQGLYI